MNRPILRRLTILNNCPSGQYQKSVKCQYTQQLKSKQMQCFIVIVIIVIAFLFFSAKLEKWENNYLSFRDIFTYLLFKFKIGRYNETRFRQTMVRQDIAT